MKMKKLMIVVAAVVAFSGCCTAPCGRESKTTFMKDALAPYVESGALPGAVSILYKDGVTEVACVGYADVKARRPITADDVYMQCSQTKGFCGVTVAKLVEEGRAPRAYRLSEQNFSGSVIKGTDCTLAGLPLYAAFTLGS